MSDPDRLSPEVLANLRAIRAGQPWPCPEIAVPRFAAISPTDFAPGSTWMLTSDGASVLALADERDALLEQVKALTNERAALLAPVGDVDLEEVLRLESTPARTLSTAEDRDGALAYAAPALTHEVARLRAALRLADEQSAEAVKRVSSEILADKWNSTADLQQKVKALTTDLKHVEHALGDRIKPGQTLERAIADLIADLDRAGEVAALKALTDERAAVPTPLRRFVGRVIGGDMDLNSVTIQLTAPDTVAGVTIGSSAEAMTLQAEVERLRARVQEAETRADNAYAEGLSDGQTAAERECDADHEAQPDPEKVAAFKAEMERVCAQFEETRLTLLAEQGKPEGAPPGWSYKPGDPDFDEPGEWVHKKLRLKVWKSGTGWVWGRKERSGVFVGPSEQEDGQPARVVMLAATAAVKSGGAR